MVCRRFAHLTRLVLDLNSAELNSLFAAPVKCGPMLPVDAIEILSRAETARIWHSSGARRHVACLNCDLQFEARYPFLYCSEVCQQTAETCGGYDARWRSGCSTTATFGKQG